MSLVFVSCNGDVKVIKSEAWNNLMPGAEGKTHVLLTVDLPEENYKIQITTFRVFFNSKELELEKSDYSIEYGPDRQAKINASFKPVDKEIKELRIYLSGRTGGDNFEFESEKIEVENVY